MTWQCFIALLSFNEKLCCTPHHCRRLVLIFPFCTLFLWLCLLLTVIIFPIVFPRVLKTAMLKPNTWCEIDLTLKSLVALIGRQCFETFSCSFLNWTMKSIVRHVHDFCTLDTFCLRVVKALCLKKTCISSSHVSVNLSFCHFQTSLAYTLILMIVSHNYDWFW